MLDSKVLNTDYDLAEMIDLQRPNLLDNADFKSGIINQRGQEEYNLGTGNTGNKPTIDRWIGNCTYVKPYDGYLYIKDNIDTAKAYLYQNLSSVCNGDYTVYINISSMRGGTLNLYFDGELANKFTISEQGEHVYTFKGVSNQNVFTLELDGFDGNIECIKLEKGSFFTGMPLWDETLEILKCYRYFYPLGGGWIGMFPARSDENTHSIYIQTPVTMRGIPTLLVKDGSDISNALANLSGNKTTGQLTQVACSTFSVSETNIFVCLTAPRGSTDKIGYGFALFQKAMALDAETYIKEE